MVLASSTSALTQTVGVGPVTTLTSTLKLTPANSGQSFDNYRISTDSGDCVDLSGARNVTFSNSDIGPCGGRGIAITGGSGEYIYDSYIHVEKRATGCCDSHDGIFINFSNDDVVQGNVVAYGESNVQTFGSYNVRIVGNFLLNPLGPFPRGEQIQTGRGSDIRIINNLVLSTSDTTLGPAIGTGNTAFIPYGQDDTGNRPSDNLSIYTTQNVDVENNYITGGLDATTPGSGGSQAASGCGLIADGADIIAANRVTFKDNTLVNTGQCGIGIATGTNHIVTGNKTINLNPNGHGNTAVYIWKQYRPACGPVLLNGNIASLIRSTGYASGYWNGGGCGSVTCDGTNTNIDNCNNFDYGSRRTAYKLLTPILTKVPPPLIPPLPKNCVVKSPFSTQTALPSCP
jgi:hypothetical protein